MKRSEMVYKIAEQLYTRDPLIDYGPEGDNKFGSVVSYDDIPTNHAIALLNESDFILDIIEQLGMSPPSYEDKGRFRVENGYRGNEWEKE